MLWLTLIFPLVTAIILAVFFARKMHVWEFVGLFALPLIFVTITRYQSESVMVKDTEYWGGYSIDARYYEDWNEYIHQTCVRSYPCGTDSQGNIEMCTETYDCSYVQYHPPYWEMNDSNGSSFPIPQSFFEDLSRRWGNKAFVDMQRNYHTDDGDMYITKWTDGNRAHAEITTIEKNYENRVQASHSIFQFKKIKPKDARKMGLFEYPPIRGWDQGSVLGDVPNKDAADRAVAVINGFLGARSKARVFVLVWRDKPITVATNQQAYWKGGNKNELIVCIGTDKNDRPQWCFPFGWTKLEDVKVDARDFVMKQKKLDVIALAGVLYKSINSRILRRDFREFRYLIVNPPMWLVITAFVLVLLFCFGWGFWSATNEFDKDGVDYDRYRFRF